MRGGECVICRDGGIFCFLEGGGDLRVPAYMNVWLSFYYYFSSFGRDREACDLGQLLLTNGIVQLYTTCRRPGEEASKHAAGEQDSLERGEDLRTGIQSVSNIVVIIFKHSFFRCFGLAYDISSYLNTSGGGITRRIEVYSWVFLGRGIMPRSLDFCGLFHPSSGAVLKRGMTATAFQRRKGVNNSLV